MVLKPGQIIGDYEVIDLLETCHEGITYKVRNILLQRFEALRILPKSLQDDPERVTRFQREAKVHARIAHPNIISFYHATQLGGQLVITTELVEGTTLAQRRELGPLPLAEALSFISQVLSALAYAHALGFVHRNVTPSNIILTPEGSARLTGFNLAKATTDPQMTQPGTVIGSLKLPPAPMIVNPEVPAELSEIILTAMAKDPSHRYQTAEEFQRCLDRVRGVSPSASQPEQQAPPIRELDIAMVRNAHFASREMHLQRSSWHLWAAGFFTFVVVVLTFLAVTRRF